MPDFQRLTKLIVKHALAKLRQKQVQFEGSSKKQHAWGSATGKAKATLPRRNGDRRCVLIACANLWSVLAMALTLLGTPLQAQFAYVTNSGDNTVSGYIMDPASGALTPIKGSPFAAGILPTSVAVNPTGKFAYVANLGDNTVSGYTIDPATGALTPIANFTAGIRPQSVAVDPSGKFVYVTNSGSGNVSGYTTDPATGTLGLVGIPFAFHPP